MKLCTVLTLNHASNVLAGMYPCRIGMLHEHCYNTLIQTKLYPFETTSMSGSKTWCVAALFVHQAHPFVRESIFLVSRREMIFGRQVLDMGPDEDAALLKKRR